MSNKYCNLDGTKKIKNEYSKINDGFAGVEADINEVDERISTIITTPAEGVTAQEIIDARKGETALGDKIDAMDAAHASHEAENEKQIMKVFNTSGYGTINDGNTDNTAKVQEVVNLAGLVKGVVFVPENTKFILQNIVMPENIYMQFRASDAGLSNYGGRGFTQEWVNFSNCSNVAGAVNEFWFASPYHPGIIINNMKNITANNLGAGQAQDYSAGSLSWADEGVGRFQLLGAGDYGLVLNYYEMRDTITGINSNSFVTPPVAGDILTGTMSGAQGAVAGINASVLIIRQISGEFVEGETVSSLSETTSDTILTISSAYTTRGFRMLCDIRESGYMAFMRNKVRSYPVEIGNQLAIITNSDNNINAGVNADLVFLDDNNNKLRILRFRDDYFYIVKDAVYEGRIGAKGYELKRGVNYYPSSLYGGRGDTASRPANGVRMDGMLYFDTTLAANGKPIWWNEGAVAWVDSTGTNV